MSYLQKTLTNLFRLIVVILILGTILTGYGYFYIKYKLPDVQVLNDVHLQQPMHVYTLDGKLIAEYGEMRRIPVTLQQVPPLLIDAVLATEDSRFYEHSGVDPISILRAVKQLLTTGRKEQGASTITMQVARNYFLTRKKTFLRKFNEMLLAMMIEQEFSKEKILELYLNKIYLGNRAYGVAAAAKVYYDETLNQLTLAQMAMIAGLAQSPSHNNPVVNPSAALDRRNHVLARMLENHFITPNQFQEALHAPLTARYHGPTIEFDAPFIGEMARQAMFEKYGPKAYNEGFKVYTTITSQLQSAATEALQNGLIAYDRRHNSMRLPKDNLGFPSADNHQAWLKFLKRKVIMGKIIPGAVLSNEGKSSTVLLRNGETVKVPWTNLKWMRIPPASFFKVGNVIRLRQKDNIWEPVQIPHVEGALVAINPHDGAILAIQGGFDFYKNSFNRATQGELQPGSSFKPFLYSAAFEQGFTLASIVNDSPVIIHIPGQKTWAPHNSDHKFKGPMRLRIALALSRNMVSIRLLEALGVPNAIDYLARFGFDPLRLPRNLTLALGTAQLTPLEIISAYAAFANGGYKVTPYFIDHVADSAGQLLYQAHPKMACPECNDVDAINFTPPPADRIAPQIISPQNAYLMNSALQDVIRNGTGRQALELKRSDLAGKTGTTNDKVDAWFSGFNADIATTVWVGFDQPRSLKEYGAQAALPIWMEFMAKALADKPEHTLPEPPGIVYARIDPQTGARVAAGNDKDTKDATFEVFTAQSVPDYQAAGYDNFDNNDTEINDENSDYQSGGNGDLDLPTRGTYHAPADKKSPAPLF